MERFDDTGEQPLTHHHFYSPERKDWFCEDCQVVTDYCKQYNDFGQEVPLPAGFKEGHDATLACPHRDLSVCPDCANRYVEIVEVVGSHYWVSHPEEREELHRHLEQLE